jgi:demethylphylloquinone reductase
MKMLNITTEANILDKTVTIPTQLIEAQKLPTIILGGGFTGLFTALHLSHQHYQTPTILIDQGSRFIFKPLLYEFLSGEMNTRYIWGASHFLFDRER